MKPCHLIVAALLALLGCQSKPDTLLTLLPAEHTGITFANTITESEDMNILVQEYIYNGGGVGAADFNGDGLTDLYFTGNQVSNKLYLNKGGLRFEDVTEKAGVTGNGKWCSGVVVVDINQDGRQDIYVGATIKKDSASRANMLFVNQGNGTDGTPRFTEEAAKYGIDDKGHTTTAAFFDYDKDGDLDLYVLEDFISDQIPTNYRKKITDGTAINNDQLYRNDGERFTNVTKQAGIVYEGFGLGLNISDINLDGWPDIYVTNDYISNDLLYVNNRDGTFTNQADKYLRHTCYSAMGNDVVDVNNDGLVDIVALDMLPEDNLRKKRMFGINTYTSYLNNEQYGYQHQYVRNVLQLNNGITPDGHPTFSDIGQLAGVFQTDWSWAPLVADFDNDGHRDMIITNGFPRDVTDKDFTMYRSGPAGAVASNMYLVDSIPSAKVSNYAFRNTGSLTFDDVTEQWGMKIPSFSNGAVYADLDNDGDLDVVVNNINDVAFVYENRLNNRGRSDKNDAQPAHYLRIRLVDDQTKTGGLGTKIRIRYAGGKQQYYEHSPYRGYVSTVENVAHFGLGAVAKADSVEVFWPDGKYQLLRNVPANQVLAVRRREAVQTQAYQPLTAAQTPVLAEISAKRGLQFLHTETDVVDFYLQSTLPHKLSQDGPALAVGDINGDGLDDIYVGGAARLPGTVFEQQPDGRFRQKNVNPAAGGNAINETGKISEDQGALLFDADNDGDNDLYCASGSYEFANDTTALRHRFYRNDGRGRLLPDAAALPEFYTAGSCVRAADFDRDGDLDLFVGGRVVPGRYPLPPDSRLLVNDGKGRFADLTDKLAPGLRKIGMVTDALWTDFDNDGWTDLAIVGEWMPITFLKNEGGKAIRNPKAEIRNSVGWWNSLVAADFDDDGDMDYVAGNLGLNTNYKCTAERPFSIYAADYDNNGKVDPVLVCYIKDEQGTYQPFPIHTRDDLSTQLLRVRRTYQYYHHYGRATVNEVLSDAERKSALSYHTTQFASCYIENLGGGKFDIRPLPVEAQVSPVLGIQADDIDQDGHYDLLLVGNNYGGEVFTGRYDASVGLFLKGDGKGNFLPKTVATSGFYVPGDAKALARVQLRSGEPIYVATQNRDSLRVFTPLRKPTGSTVRLQPLGAWAEITLRNGRKRRVELPYGSSYLSQSSRTLAVPADAVSVKVFGFDGKGREVASEKRIVKSEK